MENKQFGFLLDSVNEQVQVDRGGPESQKGKLLSVQMDHLVLLGEDGNVYYYLFDHIKSVTVKDENCKDEKGKEETDQKAEKQKPRFIMKRTFRSLLCALENKKVKVNRGGPEKVEGLLVETNPHYFVLLSNKETINIPIKHVRDIQWEPVKNEDKQTHKQSHKQSQKPSNRQTTRRSAWQPVKQTNRQSAWRSVKQSVNHH